MNISTRGFGDTSSSSGVSAALNRLMIAAVPHSANTRPSAPPQRGEQQALGQELADQPRAGRRRRTCGSPLPSRARRSRTSSRLATLTEAISSTIATMPISTLSAVSY